MEVVGLIMAGGEGKRMEIAGEKPLIRLGGKTMIEHVMDSLKDLREIERIVVATSSNTPETARLVNATPVEVINTRGKGYHSDMEEAVREIGGKTVLVISADLPLVKAETLGEIVKRFANSSKPALSVFVDRGALSPGLSPGDQLKLEGKNVSPAGINIVEGGRIDDPYIEQENVILSGPELLNVNDEDKLQLAREILSSRGGGS